MGTKVYLKNSTNVEMTKKWVEVYIPLLETQLHSLDSSSIAIGMANNETTKSLSSKQQTLLENAFHQGVPTELRKTVWSMIVPNNLKITEKLYQVLLQKVKVCEENSEKDTQFRKNLKVIEEDLHRTYSEMKVFRQGNRLY